MKVIKDKGFAFIWKRFIAEDKQCPFISLVISIGLSELLFIMLICMMTYLAVIYQLIAICSTLTRLRQSLGDRSRSIMGAHLREDKNSVLTNLGVLHYMEGIFIHN